MLDGKKTLALYIHIPWCEKKCPYCDFNSHAVKSTIPEADYVSKLCREIALYQDLLATRQVSSIFIGGGTPSLFSAKAYDNLLTTLRRYTTFCEDIEITLEANPGSAEQARFEGYRQAGINRLSIGVQSFDREHLQKLGRIHSSDNAIHAVHSAKSAGFERINIDLMYALPEQTIERAMQDLRQAFALPINHLSWYQLTMEPNTLFYVQPPSLPGEDLMAEIEASGQALIHDHGFHQYEISAYGRAGDQCRHNLNYWRFGDYLGIGAGAHSKLSDAAIGTVTRHWNIKHPKQYLEAENPCSKRQALNTNDLLLEFMLNHLRLFEPIPFARFGQATGLDKSVLTSPLKKAAAQNFIEIGESCFTMTALGHQYLNDCLAIFMHD